MEPPDPSQDAASANYWETPISWEMSFDGEGFTPYRAEVDGKVLRVRMNPPGAATYTLLVGGQELESFNDWPDAWKQPGVQSMTASDAQEEGPSIEPRLLREWSETLCRLASASPEEIAAGLGLQTSVSEFNEVVAEPPLPGTRKVTLVKHPGGFSYVEIRVSGRTLTRAQLDAHFGEGRELPRVHYDSPHTLAYDVEVPGAPYKCAVFADFREDPTTPGTPAIEITLRRDPA